MPTYGRASAHGVSAVAKASRPHGMPLNGQVAADRLDRHPGDAPTRPARRGSRYEDGCGEPEQAVEGRLQAGERDPRVGADHAHPEHQHVAEGDAEDEARQPGPAQPAGRGWHRTSAATANGIR